MSDVNITKVHLLNVPLENDYKHTFYFASQTEQLNYFKSKVVNTLNYNDFSYQRKDSTMRIPVPFDEALKCNYVMYQNTAYSNKWFYAFITDYEFKGDDQTNITIETDVLQTWLFDYTLKPSFVEREHTNDDTVGSNTVPENLEIGDYICRRYDNDPALKNTHIVLGSTVDSQNNDVEGGNYNGIYSCVKYYSYPKNDGATFVNNFLKVLDNDEAVQSVFIAPEFLTTDSEGTLGIANSNTVATYDYTLTEAENTYETKNNKLLTFPYRYILAGNNNGASAIYKYEMFKQGLKFVVQGALTPGCSIRMIPKNYNGVVMNHEEGLNLGKYPICNWASDIYTNWLTQNSVNIALNVVSGTAQIIAGVGMSVATSGVGVAVGGGMIASGVGQIAGQLGQIHQMSFVPPQAKGNTNCGDVVTGANQNTFHYYQMQIKEEYHKIIDEYFSMFGYKTNRVKVPNKNHRENYWYTKTIDVNIAGVIPVKDLQNIKNIYNNGITFWKNEANFKNYNASNNII